MSSHFTPEDQADLPDQPVRRLLEPVTRFLRIEAISGVILLLAALAALAIANSPWADPVNRFWSLPIGIHAGTWSFRLPLTHVINDGLMTLFFFVIGLEVKRELALGELRRPQVAFIPVAAAIGGMLVPPLLYLALQMGQPGAKDWGVVMVTDTAFVIGALAIFGERVPHSLRTFVLSVAVIDDVAAVAVIATAYSENLQFWSLGLGALVIVAVIGLRYLGVRLIPVYFLAGALAWFVVDLSGIHPTIVGIVLGLFTPARPWIGAERFQSMIRRISHYLSAGERGDAHFILTQPAHRVRSIAVAARELLSPLERLEFMLHPWVSFLVLPVFAFASAGISLRIAGLDTSMVTAVIVGSVVGKPIGIFAGSMLAVKLSGTPLPHDLSWTLIAAAGSLCGISFTMGLFVASLAFDSHLLGAATLGVLGASLGSVVIGMTLLAVALRLGKPRPAK
ncbi:MAG: Na+/H+ antiporter NhaA [Alphaproteobacteria bacterium]|nr:Na+/H+ antiporter NhaA [Alphaproteobacteria bacterium]